MNHAHHMIAYWANIATEAAVDPNEEVRACYLNLMGLAEDYMAFVNLGTPLPSYMSEAY